MACLTGDETGLIKSWDISKKSGAVCQYSYGAQSRSKGVAAMAWVSGETKEALISTKDGCLSVFDRVSNMKHTTVQAGIVAATSSALSVIDETKAVVISKEGNIRVVDWEAAAEEARARTTSTTGEATNGKGKNGITADFDIETAGTVEAVAIHRKYGLVLAGGQDTELKLYDLRSERYDVPVFEAENIQDHVLGVPYPVYNTGVCFVNPHVYGVTTAYHDVRFYDRRITGRPVQEFRIDKEICRRPTCMMQWNCNKFLISEASGDVHLYDTRRGFASRAKLRGGVGSVRAMIKHPAGFQLLGVIGLDRKVRIYHVPTGKMLQSIYLKQKGQSFLFTKDVPFQDDRESYTGIMNSKVPEKKNVLADDFWDDMDPVTEFVEGEEKEPDMLAATSNANTNNGSSSSSAAKPKLKLKLKRKDDSAVGPAPSTGAALVLKRKRSAA